MPLCRKGTFLAARLEVPCDRSLLLWLPRKSCSPWGKQTRIVAPEPACRMLSGVYTGFKYLSPPASFAHGDKKFWAFSSCQGLLSAHAQIWKNAPVLCSEISQNTTAFQVILFRPPRVPLGSFWKHFSLYFLLVITCLSWDFLFCFAFLFCLA